jgi:hypothetical protein
MVADILAAEYHWDRQTIWWELDFAEISLYLQAIIHRKAAESGKGAAEEPVTDELVELYEVIEAVKAEKRNGHQKT